jgi:hypothetical protein
MTTERDKQNEKMDEMNAAMDSMVDAERTFSERTAGEPEVEAYNLPSPMQPRTGAVYRGKMQPIKPAKIDVSDARVEGFTHPESDNTANLSSISDGMRDYHNRLMDVLRTMQQILFDGIAELNEIQGRFNRIR